MDAENAVSLWLKQSKKDLAVAQSLFDKKHYAYALFFCHLTLEKILKALVAKTTKENPPYTHDLKRLALIGKIGLAEEQAEFLDDVSLFNVAGRYQDAKTKFYKLHNKKEFAEKYLKKTKEMLIWLKKEYLKK